MGRSVEESLNAVRDLTGLELAFFTGEPASGKVPFLGRSFWQAFIRGGYQGAAYFVDSLISNAGKKT
jgi:hypothetical protein